MGFLLDGMRESIRAILTLDSQILDPALRSLWISSLALTIATAAGVPLGVGLACRSFPGRSLLVLLFRAGMALPTVFIGILCYGMFSRHGSLGPLDLLYTPWAIVAGEFLLALPIIVSITHGAVRSLDPRVAETAITLGADVLRRGLTYVSEARTGVTLAVLTAFARCITELGIAMMVGGNIRGRTRTLATATAMETGMGEFARGLATGTILLTIALCVTAAIGCLSRETDR